MYSRADRKTRWSELSEPDGAVGPQHELAIGAEVGSRGLRVVLTDRNGKLRDSLHGINPRTNASITVEALCEMLSQILDRNEIESHSVCGVGIAFGGPVDTLRGTILSSPRAPGFVNYPLASIVEERFGLPTLIENDARAAAFGEFEFGAGRGSHTMIYLQLGIGVGGGIVLNGHLHHGTAMTAGEIGHMPVTTNGPRCSCGKPGHLEAYVSEPAILEQMRELLAEAPADKAEEWWKAPGVTLRRIFESADDDVDAGAVADEATKMTGLALANLVTALNADAVVLGGYALDLGPEYLAAIRSRIRQYAFEAAAQRLIVSVGQLGQVAAVTGAAALIFDRVDSQA